jgi:hypothetical protein
VSVNKEEAIKTTLNSSYLVVAKRLKAQPGRWACCEVSIFEPGRFRKRKLGSYIRNYHSFGVSTWYPFSRGAKDYALYSRDYTCTRLMELPSCKDIGGEDPSAGGFCPVEYLIPEVISWEKEPDSQKPGLLLNRTRKTPADVALVAGCFWGDDSSWKIQCFDLSQVESGIIARDERFGYVAMPKESSLTKSVYLERDEESGVVRATFPILQTFDFATGERLAIDPFE